MEDIPMRFFLIIILVFMLLCPISSYALELTLNIKGSMEEISKVLECLKQSGLGLTSQQEGMDPFRIHIYSSNEASQEETQNRISIGFTEIRIEPENPISGTPIKIMAKMVDTLNIVDTLSATLFGTSISIDLKDDGQNGDETAGDRIWSGIFNLPADVSGNKTFILTAFDEKGRIIQIKSEEGILKPVIGTYDCIIHNEEKKQN